MPSIRVVILLGDPEWLPPIFISHNRADGSAGFLKRSLMERLYKAGYRITDLEFRYRTGCKNLPDPLRIDCNHRPFVGLARQHGIPRR